MIEGDGFDEVGGEAGVFGAFDVFVHAIAAQGDRGYRREYIDGNSSIWTNINTPLPALVEFLLAPLRKAETCAQFRKTDRMRDVARP
ncbi:MAG TPA: hypothetical protein VEX43_06385 [Chthoniobacterales bacterium]|nr:hypothetical protein [Chthoniobacterales bacterium]